MNGSHSDALVFFGATGDLAYKKIFPSLQAGSPVFACEPGTWGPAEAAAVTPSGGWADPATVS